MKNNISTDGERSLLSRDLLVLSGCFLFIFMGAGATQQFLITNFSAQTGRTYAQCSWILAMVYFAGLVFRIYSAHTIRFLGMYRAIVFGLGTYTLFAFCAMLLDNYWLLLLAAGMWGWGAAAVWITSPTQIIQATAAKRYGSASGIFYSSVYIGQAVGVLLLGRLLKEGLSFQEMLLVAIAISLVGNVISLFLPRRSIPRDAPPKVADVFGALKTVKIWELAFIQFATSFGFGLVLSSVPSAAEKIGRGDMIYLITLGYYIGRIVASWIVGRLSDWIGRDKVMLCMFLGASIGLIPAVLTESFVALSLASVMLGLQAGTVPTIVTAMVGDATDADRRHLVFAALSLLPSFGIGFTIVGSQYLQILLGGFNRSLLVYAIVFLICIFLTVDIGRRASEKL